MSVALESINDWVNIWAHPDIAGGLAGRPAEDMLSYFKTIVIVVRCGTKVFCPYTLYVVPSHKYSTSNQSVVMSSLAVHIHVLLPLMGFPTVLLATSLRLEFSVINLMT